MPSTQSTQQPPETTGASFFASIRRAGIVRTQDRWGGGVAGGLARRFNIDPAIMRGVLVVVTLFSGVGLLVYGLCWALLPEERDGRIHLEEAMAGRFDAALAAAGAAVVIGLARPGLWFFPFGGSGAWGVFVAILAIGAVIAIVAVAHSRTVSDREAAGANAPPGGAAWTGGSGWTSGSAWGGAPAGGPGAAAPTGTGMPVGTGAPADTGAHADTGAPVAPEATGEPAGPDGSTETTETTEPTATTETPATAGTTGPVGATEQTVPLASSPPPLWSAQAQPAGPGPWMPEMAPAGAPSAAGPMPQQPVQPVYSGAPIAGPPPVPPPPPAPAGPSRWRRSAPGYRVVLVGLAGVFLVVAAVLVAWFGGYVTMEMPPLVMAGGALVAVGGVIAVAGFMGRRGGLLTAVGIVGVIVATVLVGTAFDGYGRPPLTWDSARTVADAPSTFRVTSVADFERFESWQTTGDRWVVLDLTPLAENLPEAGLDLGDLQPASAEPFEVRLPTDVPVELRVTGEGAWVDAGDLTGVHAEAVRVVEGWDWNQWVLGANSELTFTTGVVGEPLRLHLNAPNSNSTTVTFVQEQS